MIHFMVARPLSSSLLSFVPSALRVTQVLPTTERVTIKAIPRSLSADCPVCMTSSQRIHSVYRRQLYDLPWQGRTVTIHLAARRFRCVNRGCARQIFVERLTGVAQPFGRRTGRLHDLQRQLGLALGGEAGARIAARIAAPTSADTLLRLASGRCPSATPAALRVLGIDDWAWRRGRRYGTIMVNLETNKVVDLLPDREAATVARWLRERPGVEIVARDRAGAYSDGIRQGASGAIQVADRWHLLRNLGDAVQALGARHHAAVGRAAQSVLAHLTATRPPQGSLPVLSATVPNSAQQASAASYARRRLRYEEVARLRDLGATITRISVEIGADRKTVHSWLRLGQAPLWIQPRGDSILDSFKPFLGRRWQEGCRNATQLWRELLDLGFRGSSSIVREWAAGQRGGPPGTGQTDGSLVPPVWPVPRGYRLGRLLMTSQGAMDAEERIFMSHLLAEEPALDTAVAWAKRLHNLLRKRVFERLDDVLDAATGTLFARFAASLRRDFAAISASLVLPWTTSPVEGQISRLKMLKRTMYGRAGFNLLRGRVLDAP